MTLLNNAHLTIARCNSKHLFLLTEKKGKLMKNLLQKERNSHISSTFFCQKPIVQRHILEISIKNWFSYNYSKEALSVSFKLHSLVSTKVVSETERTLGVFQGFGTLGFISNKLHYYSASHSVDKQGHETNCQKVMVWRTNQAESCQQPFDLSFKLTPSSSCWWGFSKKTSTDYSAAIFCSLTSSQCTLEKYKLAYLFSWRSWGIMTSCYRSKHFSVRHPPNEAASGH